MGSGAMRVAWGTVRLTIVGCSGSFPGPDSPASCYLVEAEGFRLLVDLGSGALGALQRHAGLQEIDAVWISHLHADHCLDLCCYSVARTYHPDGPRPRIPVYGPFQTAVRLGRALTADPAAAAAGAADPGHGITDAFGFTTITPGTTQIGPLRVATRGRHVSGGWFDEEAEVWDAAGRLVAQSRQIARVGRSSRERDPGDGMRGA